MEQVWWERVPNALAFLAEITESLLSEKSIVLHYATAIPWHNYFVGQIQESVMQQNSSKKFEVIQGIDNPGEYLLREYCKPEKRAQYRPSKTYARFFAESDDIVLHERYFWIYADSVEALNNWMEFVSEYVKQRSKNKEIAVFIIEWNGHGTIRPIKGVRAIYFDDYIGEYDRVAFSTLAASSIREDPLIKTYLAELTASIAGNNIELSALCLENYKEFLQDTFTFVDQFAIMCTHDGVEGQLPFKKDKDEIKRCIWRAQIKTLYPIIEEYRESFVEKHKEEISRELPIATSYGEEYVDPKDVELGTLVYMVGAGKLSLVTSEYRQLDKYKTARNKLSHLNILEYIEIKELIG